MKCNTIHKKLIFYLDGELSPKEMQDIKNHLSECQECVSFAEELKKMQAILTAEKSVEPNPFFYTRLKAKMEAEESVHYTPGWQPVWVKVLQPAVFTVLLIAGVYFGSKIGKPAPVNIAVAAFSDQDVIPYLNEMDTEPIEAFLME
jgi:anti-sigma factor RsiW